MTVGDIVVAYDPSDDSASVATYKRSEVDDRYFLANTTKSATRALVIEEDTYGRMILVVLANGELAWIHRTCLRML